MRALDLIESQSHDAAVIGSRTSPGVLQRVPVRAGPVRGRADGAGGRYQHAAEPMGTCGCSVKRRRFRLTEFIDPAGGSAGRRAVEAIGGDRARKAELEDAMVPAHWDYVPEPVGSALEVAAAVRAFRRAYP